MKKTKKETLRDLLIIKLQALYDMESELVKALPKLSKQASDPALKVTFEVHGEQTKEHVIRLEQAFALLDIEPKKLKSEAIRGLVKDAMWAAKNVKAAAARDAALVAAAQYIEHYEMAGYFGASSWAELMGEQEVASLLSENLGEEKMADQEITELAVTTINARANTDE